MGAAESRRAGKPERWDAGSDLRALDRVVRRLAAVAESRAGKRWRFPITRDAGTDDPLSYLRLVCTRRLDDVPFPLVRIETSRPRASGAHEPSREVVVSVLGLTDDGVVDALGFGFGHRDDRAFWLEFLESLVARGLRGVEGVSSEACEPLGEAVIRLFPDAVWLCEEDDQTAGGACPRVESGPA